jgi:glycosyltransferase involved in cell wall biosynthesis
MLYLFFPIGNGTGWDMCGKYLTLALSQFVDVGVVTTSQITPGNIGDELECFALSQIPINSVDGGQFNAKRNFLNGVSIRTLNDFDLSLWLEDIKSEKTIGYTFYCGFPLSKERRDSARGLDLIVAGSSFCEEQLKKAGIEKTKTVIQGINPQIFNPANSSKSLFKDRFVIFSGGKFEFRKGQDIVIRAFKLFSDKYSDALLVNSWFNYWEFSIRTMAASTLIGFTFDFNDYLGSMNNLYRINGLEPNKVITLPIKPPHQLAHIFKNTDIGLFPNRCEGGTNLMLMEYMACGKPVIASAQTGHADIVEQDNAFPIGNNSTVRIREGDPSEYQGWVEPDLDEILSHLETAYLSQEACKKKGEVAGHFLSELTWERAALEFSKTARELA